MKVRFLLGAPFDPLRSLRASHFGGLSIRLAEMVLVHHSFFAKQKNQLLLKTPMVVILDNIRSLHNVGSIFRTADGAGVEKLYLCGITPSPLDRFGTVRSDLAKVALGAEKTVAWEQAKTTTGCIANLKKQGFTVVALEQAPESISIYNLTPNTYNLSKLALVLGAEVEGVSPAALKKSDGIIEIPMVGAKESLNVSVAFGIAAFALRDRLTTHE